MGLSRPGNIARGYSVVDMAESIPGNNLFACILRGPHRKIPVRDTNDPFIRQRFNNFYNISRGTTNIALGLDLRSRIHIGNNWDSGIFCLNVPERKIMGKDERRLDLVSGK